MSWQTIKETLVEWFHNLGLTTLYHQDPELQLIPIERENHRPR